MDQPVRRVTDPYGESYTYKGFTALRINKAYVGYHDLPDASIGRLNVYWPEGVIMCRVNTLQEFAHVVDQAIDDLVNDILNVG